VEFHSGSLGHLFSVAMGVALDVRLRGGPNRVFVVLGDGEMDEGSVWEAALVASALALDNLVVVVDRNGFQANIETESLVPLEPLDRKLEAFGFAVRTTDGHSFSQLADAFANFAPGKPTAIIARTLRGKGLASLENRADRWFVRLTSDEVESLLAELRGAAAATLSSPTLVVR
jgi:transketolase